MRLVLLRHAATPGNAEHRYVGRRTDEPLSASGRAQCLSFGAVDTVEVVYVSPMRRACETAQLCFPAARLVRVPGLEECDFGDFEGRTPDEMEHDVAYRAWVDGGCTTRCPHGEAPDEFWRRSNEALVGLLREARSRGERDVIVVGHGGTIMAALGGLGPAGGSYFDYHAGNCEGYEAEVSFEGDAVRLIHPHPIRTPHPHKRSSPSA